MTTPDADIRVLIVDDNRTVRRGIRLRLENATGIRVAGEAANGRDAVVLAHAERADVVLMDLHMPGMNGIEATRLITADEQSGCRVILLTSEVSDAFVVDAIEAGASGYLLKGHDSDQLLPVIRGAAAGTATISPRVAPRLIRELREARSAPADPEQVTLLTASGRRAAQQRGHVDRGHREATERVGEHRAQPDRVRAAQTRPRRPHAARSLGGAQRSSALRHVVRSDEITGRGAARPRGPG